MRFKLRTLFIVIFVAAVMCGLVVFVEQTWFGPARVGLDAQAQLDTIFAKHKWKGQAGTWHYDFRVRIVSSSVGDKEIEELYPISARKKSISSGYVELSVAEGTEYVI